MSGWEIFWTIVAILIIVAIIGAVVTNLSDLMRYMKIRRM